MSPCPSANPADYPQAAEMNPQLSDSPSDPMWETRWQLGRGVTPDVRTYLTQAKTRRDAIEAWRRAHPDPEAVHLTTRPKEPMFPEKSPEFGGTTVLGKIEGTTQAVSLAKNLLNSQVFLKRGDEMPVYPEASGIVTRSDGHEASFMLTDLDGFEYVVTVMRTGKKRKPLPSVPGTVIAWKREDGDSPRLARLTGTPDLWILYSSESGVNRRMTPKALQETIGDAEWKIVGVAK